MPFSRPFTPPALSSSLITNHHQNNNNNGGHGTPPDHDMMEPSPRPSLPSSLADFALPHSAPSSPSMSLMALDEPHPYSHMMNASPSPIGYPLLRKIRRPSLLGLGLPKGTLDMNILTSGYSSRMNSPLISSFTSPFSFDCPPGGGRSVIGGGTPSSSSGNGSANPDRSTNTPQDEEEFAPELMFDNAEPSPHIRESSTEPTQIEEPASPSPTRIKRKSRSPTPTRSNSATLTTPSLQPPIDIDYKNSAQRRILGSAINSNSNSNSGNGGGNNPGNGNINPPRLLLPPKSPTSGAAPGRPAIPRLLTILSESNMQESEVKSEASFQRLIASHAELPPRRGLFHPRTPRSRQNSASGGIAGRRMMYYRTDRGRFPEEAFDEDELLADDDQGSSDDGDDEESAVGVSAPGGGNAVMSFNDDSATSLMSLGGSGGSGHGSLNAGSMLDSPAGMDLDFVSNGWSHAQMFGSPPVNNGAALMSGHSTPSTSAQWRHTPPPTATTARGSKRKFDDRYEPYPTAKRRAVSPAISLSGNTMMGASPISIPRSPITIPRPLPLSATSSPILRPVVRLSSSRGGSSNMMGLSDGGVMMIGSWNNNNGKNDEREVQGAGDGVGSLTL